MYLVFVWCWSLWGLLVLVQSALRNFCILIPASSALVRLPADKITGPRRSPGVSYSRDSTDIPGILELGEPHVNMVHLKG